MKKGTNKNYPIKPVLFNRHFLDLAVVPHIRSNAGKPERQRGDHEFMISEMNFFFSQLVPIFSKLSSLAVAVFNGSLEGRSNESAFCPGKVECAVY